MAVRSRAVGIIASAAVAVGILSGCAAYRPTGAYGVYFENSFLYSCELRARVAYCSCTLGYLEQNVSAQRIESDGMAIASGAGAPAYMQTAAAQCQLVIL